MQSLLSALSKKGIRGPTSIPGSFQSCPGSIKELIRCLELPAVEISQWQRASTNFDANWTDSFQGLAYGWHDETKNTGVWFFSNESDIYKVRWSPGTGAEFLKNYHCDSLGTYLMQNWHHFGDVDYFDGLVLVPFESLDNTRGSVILVFSKDLEFMAWAELTGKGDNRNTGWCAVNPWDRMLYVSDDDAGFFYVYDISGIYMLKNQPEKWPAKVAIELQNRRFWLKKPDGSPDILAGSMQGVAFSSNGRVYVSQARRTGSWTWDNHLACYDLLTGLRQDYREIAHPDWSNVAEELQGIAVCTGTNELCLVYLDNDLGGDEIDILNYWSTDPRIPV